MKYQEKCHECQHIATAFTHTINKPMVEAFIKICEYYLQYKKPCNFANERVISLTYNQRNNAQKLQYFGILKRLESGSVPTKEGLQFYYGEIAVPKTVATINNKTIPSFHPAWKTHKRKIPHLFIHQIQETHYKKRPEYQEEKSTQTSFYA